jgi:hypothetical protein
VEAHPGAMEVHPVALELTMELTMELWRLTMKL